MEELPKLLAYRRAHKAHLTKLRRKIDETIQGAITYNETALLKLLDDQLKQKKQTLKEFNDKIAVLLEAPEELEAEILDAEELDSLEKVCVTDNLIELAKRINTCRLTVLRILVLRQVHCKRDRKTNNPFLSTSQTGQENQQCNSPPSSATLGSDFQGNKATSAENRPITSLPVITFQTNCYLNLYCHRLMGTA